MANSATPKLRFAKIKMAKRLQLCLLLCLFISPLIHAQQTSPQESAQVPSSQEVLKSHTYVVVLDVVVTDKNDRPVKGLSKSDFGVSEDKESQDIASFEEHSLQDSSVAAGPETSAQTIILIDEMNTQYTDLAYARYCMRKLLQKNEGQLSQSTALMALTNKGLIVLHQPTRDGNALWSALDHHRPDLPWRLQGGVYGASERINVSLGALEQIAVAFADSPVRRSIVWISPGFPILSSARLDQSTQSKLFSAIRRLSLDLLHARLTIYTVDPRGLIADSGYVTAQTFYTESEVFSNNAKLDFRDMVLEQFSGETGGKSFWGRNDVDAEVARSMNEEANYYTLTYYPTNQLLDSKYRKISIKMNRRDLKARTRAGYFAAPEAPLPKNQLVDQFELALKSPLLYAGIPLKATATVLPGQPHSIQIVVRANRHMLTWTKSDNGDLRCEFSAASASFFKDQAPKDSKSYAQLATIPAAKISAYPEMAVVLRLTLRIDPKVTRYRFVILDAATGKMGTTELAAPFSSSQN
jgi:VWFA-related protein